jgi:hypothetical protein
VLSTRSAASSRQEPALDVRSGDAIDLGPDGVDPHAVLGLEVARLLAERLGDVAAHARQSVQVLELLAQSRAVDRAVRLDVGKPQRLRVAGGVVGHDAHTRATEGLSHAGGSREQVGRAVDAEAAHDLCQQRHQRPFGAEVLDHPTEP